MAINQKKGNDATSRLLNKSLTGARGKIITGTTVTAIDAYAIQFITECTLTALVGNLEGTVTTVVYPAGLVIYGQFSSIELAAADDTVIVYQN